MIPNMDNRHDLMEIDCELKRFEHKLHNCLFFKRVHRVV
jgi:hypothetical protein